MNYLKTQEGIYIKEVDYSYLVECEESHKQAFEDGYIKEEYINEHNLIKEEVK